MPIAPPLPFTDATLPMTTMLVPDAATAPNIVAPAHSAAALVGTIWIAGAAIGVVILAVGLARLRWLAARARPLSHGRAARVLSRLARDHGIDRRVRLLETDRPTLLVTWGWYRPTIMLPRAAREWSDDCVEIVLGHELAHIKRADWIVQLAAELLRAYYWFNPLVWIACARLRRESEQACDDAVLCGGVEGSDYAAHLLHVARTFTHHPRRWTPAAAIAHPSNLERRITAMLNVHLNRRPISRPACLITIAALLCVALPLAGAGLVAQATAATFGGSLVDTIGRVMPDVPLLLTHEQTGEKHATRSDINGRFLFAGLAGGEYQLEARVPGFASEYKVTVLAGQRIEREVALQLGTVQETIVVVGGRDSAPPPRSATVAAPAYDPDSDPCSRSAVGGGIKPPIKIADVKPQFPPGRIGTGADATVLLDGRIGIDGFIKELRVVNPVDADFGAAALLAVGKWQFVATRLDGIPVETHITVSVTFRSEP
jgi:beta-lactamase regulating signal transducer with metallopeptidase domain